MLSLFHRFKFWIGICIAMIGTVFSFWLFGKRSGKAEQKEEQFIEEINEIAVKATNEIIRKEAEVETVVEVLENANDVQKNVSNLDDASVINELRDKYTRK